MRTWLKKQIAKLEDLRRHPDPDPHIYESAAYTVRKAAEKAAQAGHLAFYDQHKLVQACTPEDAMAVLSSLLASLSAGDEYLGIEEAASRLGCSVSGLRKIVDRKAIMYFQAVKGSPILFRQEWLDEYVERNTSTPPTPFVNRYGL
jgi:excisionase family DNA binding protein